MYIIFVLLLKLNNKHTQKEELIVLDEYSVLNIPKYILKYVQLARMLSTIIRLVVFRNK